MPAAEINESRHERKLESLSRLKPSARSNRREGGGEGAPIVGQFVALRPFPLFGWGRGGVATPPCMVGYIHISAAERRSV